MLNVDVACGGARDCSVTPLAKTLKEFVPSQDRLSLTQSMSLFIYLFFVFARTFAETTQTISLSFKRLSAISLFAFFKVIIFII